MTNKSVDVTKGSFIPGKYLFENIKHPFASLMAAYCTAKSGKKNSATGYFNDELIYTPDYGMIMAGIVLATLPTAMVFFLMQKNFVKGMLGSVKG